MKTEVPAFNCVLALFYFAAAGALLFLLKKISKPKRRPAQPLKAEEASELSPSFKMLGIAWLKKYTFASIVCMQDKKYLLKEGFILSAYAVACFSINSIRLWPVTFCLFLLPITILLFEVVIKRAKQNAQESDNNAAVRNVIDQRQIQIENVGIEIQSTKQQKKGTDMLEIGIVAGMTFSGVIMFCQCSLQLANSISNSGQLNILSLLAMVPLDQLLIRPLTGLALLLTIKILEVREQTNVSSNVFVLYLCEQEIMRKREQMAKVNLKIMDDITASPLKRQNSQQIKGKIQIQAQFIDLDHLQPECIQKDEQEVRQENIEEILQPISQKMDPLEAEMYLTTPEKQLFEGTESQPSQQTIIDTVPVEKENTEPEINFSRQSDSVDIKHFDEFMLDRDPLTAFTNETIVPRRKNARKNKRVLKMSGNSPYLEYLPNMLKKVDNYKHLVNPQKQPKML